jgi:two-component system, LuxR family, sensor kinase FixL
MKKSASLIFGFTILGTFILSSLWEFAIEPKVSNWIATDHDTETIKDKWKYIYTSSLFTALALILPISLLSNSLNVQRKSVKKMQESEKRYWKLFSSNPDAILILDAESNKFMDVNESAVSLYGYTHEEFLNLSPEDISADPENTTKAIKENLKGGLKKIPYRLHKMKDGTVLEVELTAGTFKLKGEDKVFALVRDISDRKSMEEELKKQRTDFETILNSAPAYIFYKDDKNNILRTNQAAADSLGLRIKEIEGKHTKDFYPDHYEKYYADDLEVLKSRKPKLDIVEPYKVATGEIKWVRTDKVPIFDSSGNPKRLIVFAIDITKQKEAEKKLMEYSNELEEINKELQGFASIASHDLQEPLRKISIFSDRLVSKISKDDDDGRHYLERIQNASERMKDLIENLLKYSIINSQVINLQPRDLKLVAKNVLDDLETRIAESNGEVSINELPILECDSVQLHQVFINLIGNGLKFCREGIPPAIHLSSSKNEEGYWEILVSDNGIGIKEEYFKKIFMPLERLHARNKYEGTGIGLSICKKIISSHGGSISVKNNSDNGVTFIICLPEKQDKRET